MSRLKVTDLSFCRVLREKYIDVKGGLNRIAIPNYFLPSIISSRPIKNDNIVIKPQVVTVVTRVSRIRAGVVVGKNFVSSFASAISGISPR